MVAHIRKKKIYPYEVVKRKDTIVVVFREVCSDH
jgi:hypothetical protein